MELRSEKKIGSNIVYLVTTYSALLSVLRVHFVRMRVTSHKNFRHLKFGYQRKKKKKIDDSKGDIEITSSF